MFTAELTKKIDFLSRESYIKVEKFVEQLIASERLTEKEITFGIFMDKMNLAEKSIQGNGCYSEETDKI